GAAESVHEFPRRASGNYACAFTPPQPQPPHPDVETRETPTPFRRQSLPQLRQATGDSPGGTRFHSGQSFRKVKGVRLISIPLRRPLVIAHALLRSEGICRPCSRAAGRILPTRHCHHRQRRTIRYKKNLRKEWIAGPQRQQGTILCWRCGLAKNVRASANTRYYLMESSVNIFSLDSPRFTLRTVSPRFFSLVGGSTMSYRRMFVVTAMMLGCCIATVSVCGGKPDVSAKTDSREGFIVHEWGTLSTFSGSNGTYLKFYPDDHDLPGFVYNRKRYIKGGLPDVFVSLETPVLYFYTDREMTASVRVDFPKGRMTEWYPQASRPPIDGLIWDNIKITPGSQVKLPSEAGKSRYYAARETDAAPVRVAAGKDKSEQEKFLFYRGVGDFAMPLTVRARGKGEFTVKNSAKEALPAFLLVRVQGGKVR